MADKISKSVDVQETRLFEAEQIRTSLVKPGAVLRDRYRLDQEIGRGGMGIVYRGTDLQLMRSVAVKILLDTLSSKEMRDRFLREARSAASLNHPHIVAVHDVGEDAGLPFLVMELVEGPSLQNASLSLEEIVEIACQICEALDHAHRNKIIHRDLKPENVLLSATDHTSVKLADLGLALPMHSARISRAGAIVGTAAYMAPEQALGQTVDGRADLYALGVVLYQLTIGRPPFLGDDPLTTISQHVHASVVPPRALRPDLPPALESIILRLLAKDPAQRFATAAETAAALRQALRSEATAAEGDGASAVAILDALSRGRLVARSEELAEARELWRRAMDGRGHCLLLSGEPGSGKTRLAREVIVQATFDGAFVLTGGCYEYEATTPYLPFVEAFRRFVRDEKDDARLRQILGDRGPELARLAPEIETRLGPFPERHELPAHEQRLLFFDSVARVFSELARQKGLLFYVDDLHWADGSTLWLLGHLIRNLREERVLILASYRDTELDRAHPLSKALVDWNRERLTTRIGLKRFGPDETRAQLAALLGESVSGDFSEIVYRETEGNPFFIEEVMKALVERGSVRRESGRWKRCDLAELVIPQSVKEAIGSRLDRVSTECNEVLRAAAVLGKTFTFEELVAATESMNEDVVLDALDEAVSAQLLSTDSDETFSFTHDKIREVLYEELNPIRRRRLHRRTAEGLERHRNVAPVAVETLAHHYIHAGEYERGLKYAKEAAAEAERVLAFDEAVAAYGRALECAEALGLREEELALEEAMGNAEMLAGNTLPATEHFERALKLAQDPHDRARLQCQAASSLVTNGDQRGLDYVREALTFLNPQTSPMETANALGIEGRFLHLAGRHEEAIELLKKAVELATKRLNETPLPRFTASTMSNIFAWLAGAHQHLGRYADGDVWARRAVEFGAHYNIPVAQALGYEFLGENAASSGDWQAGLYYSEVEREIAAKVHSRERLAWTYVVTSLCNDYAGNNTAAEHEFRSGIALAKLIGEQRLEVLLTASMVALIADSNPDEALTLAVENLKHADALGLVHSRTEARRGLASVRFKRGEFSESLRLCEEILEIVGPGKSRVSRLWLGPLHVEVLAAMDRNTEARERLQAYRDLVAQCQAPRFEREVDRLEKLLSEKNSSEGQAA